MAVYRIRIDLTYNTVNNATTATTNINTALAGQGYSEQAVRDGTAVSLEVFDIPEADAITVRDALTSAWGVGTRSGRVATVRVE